MIDKWYFLWIYLGVINLITFAAYGIDKHNARAGKNASTGYSVKKRIPEKILIGLAALGGSVGAFAAMQLFRHKTKHALFVVGVPLCFLLWCLLLYKLLRT